MNKPTPEQLAETPKTKSEINFGSEPGAQSPFIIPEGLDYSDKEATLAPDVEGRDMRAGQDTYHSNWEIGWYVWWKDGDLYHGFHFHPDPFSPLAKDCDG